MKLIKRINMDKTELIKAEIERLVDYADEHYDVEL